MTIPLRKGPGVKHPFKIHPHQLDREGKCWQLFRTLQLLEAFDAFEYCQQQLYTDNSCIMSAQNGLVWWRSLPFNWRGLLTAAVKSVSCHTGLIPLHADILYLPWRQWTKTDHILLGSCWSLDFLAEWSNCKNQSEAQELSLCSERNEYPSVVFFSNHERKPLPRTRNNSI